MTEEEELVKLKQDVEKKELAARQEHFALLEKLRNYLLYYYVPVQDPAEAEFHFTTKELWQQMLQLYPNELLLSQDVVAAWMNTGGFKFYDFGQMRFEWLMKKAAP